MTGFIEKAKQVIMGESNDRKDIPNTASSGDPTIGTVDTTPASGVGGPHAASGFSSDPRAQDTSAAHNAAVGGSAFGSSTASDTAGPHTSNIANKLDPRVDSDRDGRAGGITSANPGYGSQHHPTATSGYGSTNAGPHSSNVANKLDPRIDSDRDGRGAYSTTHGSTNAGPHSSNIANKLDPRVDSDRDGRGAYGTTHSTTTAGPHHSNIANKLDPTVDSDRDGRSGLSSTTNAPTAGGPLSSTRGHSAYDSPANTNPHTSNLGPHQGVHNPHGTTAGHTLGVGHDSTHTSNTANKLDPRVDSDRDSRDAYGTTRSTTTAGPHHSNIANKLDPRVDSNSNRNTSATALGAGPGGLGLGQSTHGTHTTHTTHTTDYPQKYDPLVTSIPGTHNKPPGAPLTKVPVTTTSDREAGSGSGLAPHDTTANTHHKPTHLPGPAPNTAGPHKSDLLNRLDPRVDHKGLSEQRPLGGRENGPM